jgi:nicotinamidase-related amidase
MKKILIVVDAQNDFIDGALANNEAQDRVPNIVQKIEEFDGDAIFYTLDTHDETYLNTKEGEHLPIMHCIRSTEGWELNYDVAAAIEGAVNRNILINVVEKYTFGSLALPVLVKRVVGEEDFEIQIVGFCTDICVIANALILKTSYYNQGEIYVDASCCAGTTVEAHNAALAVMESCQINVINKEEE